MELRNQIIVVMLTSIMTAGLSSYGTVSAVKTEIEWIKNTLNDQDNRLDYLEKEQWQRKG